MNMVTVTQMEQLGKGKIRVKFDTGLTCILYRSEASEVDLKEQSCISEEAYQKLLKDILGKRATKRAMHLLEKMDRTEAGLREKLRQNDYPEICIDQAINYVKAYHYLDDSRYAQTYVRLAQEKKSKQRIKMDLMSKGISRELIEEALELEYDAREEEQIRMLLKKRKFEAENSDEKERQKTYQFLMRKGFKSADILRCMKMISLDMDV